MQELSLENLELVFGGNELETTPDNGPARAPHGGGSINGGWPREAPEEKYV